MKGISFFGVLLLPLTGLWAQSVGDVSLMPKVRFAGSSVTTGFAWMPRFGSAFYVAPKVGIQVTPRLQIDAGVSIAQYSLLPSSETAAPQKKSATEAYVYVSGTYLLNERWAVSGSAMKKLTNPGMPPSPYSPPSEAYRIGVDYRITPNITIGVSAGYTKDENNPFPRTYPFSRNNPFSPF